MLLSQAELTLASVFSNLTKLESSTAIVLIVLLSFAPRIAGQLALAAAPAGVIGSLIL
jgi:hypothetical protein